ncbi:MAG: hypothetical protein HWN65_10375 [Candidatus Helarchaeota archaeon]|nr:hypothetical protein [Candidatus Helarchaeota archaeon]
MQVDLWGFTNLMLRFIIIGAVFYIALMFFIKIRHARKAGRELSPFLGLGLFFLFYAMTCLFFEYLDYHANFLYMEYTEPIPTILYKGAILAAYCGMIGLVFFTERILGKTKFAFTIFNLGALSYGIFFLYEQADLQLLTYYTMPIPILFLVFTWAFILIIKTKGEIRRKMGVAFASLIGFSFFYILSIDLVKYNIAGWLGIEASLITSISYVGSLVSLLLLGFVFLSFETFTEFAWKDKMREIFIIYQNGISLFHYSFIEKASSDGADLITSGLTGVKDILMDMMETENPLKVFDHRDLKIIFEYGDHSTIVLVCEENLNIYHSKLALLMNDFEEYFQDALPNWTGDIELFRPARKLIEDVFV